MTRMNLLLLLIATLGVQTSAQAAFDWDFTNPNVTSDDASYSGKIITGTATAFSTNTPRTSTIGDGGGNGTTPFAVATASPYSGGIGINNADEAANTAPEHAIDNIKGIDALLFTFTDVSNPATKVAVTLNSVTIGWKQTDADISILAYNGNGNPPTVAGNTIAQLLSNSWVFIGHYADLALNTAKAINSGNISSSYWLVSAYSSSYGSSSGTNLSSGDDYFKISGLGGSYTTPPPGGDVPGVPEPSSLALLAFGILGWNLLRALSNHCTLKGSVGRSR